jgi:hypothetical protein
MIDLSKPAISVCEAGEPDCNCEGNPLTHSLNIINKVKEKQDLLETAIVNLVAEIKQYTGGYWKAKGRLHDSIIQAETAVRLCGKIPPY